MSAAALPTVSDADSTKAERTGRESDAHSTTSADSGNGSLNNVSSSLDSKLLGNFEKLIAAFKVSFVISKQGFIIY
ncbi:unnamed protein product [Strongylus vulgaris]|uniref:Uncharacterized protein n=1 Tax=Strongylus vulgaris TaxID=40348 RepID=A0A3P7J5P8_STRVU|nr:unnamed protein product [Strongylus vulgaris]